ncbi:hypothetical protein JHK87_006981 [Glycine soja]|nr:hypothetical protein JHK87_006981 [Glycine soja]
MRQIMWLATLLNFKNLHLRLNNLTQLQANPALDVQKEFSKAHLTASGSNAAGRPSEDVDSRTIFVSNVRTLTPLFLVWEGRLQGLVHFAATKDGLSRHFNRFGEVLKVIIVTDAATGQPKGAAYVEFMRKEAADNALSLDNTSFMSRILNKLVECCNKLWKILQALGAFAQSKDAKHYR